MNEPTQHRRFWTPSRQQELLLQAALGKGTASPAAWTQWRATADPERLDDESWRLFPLLYRALQGQGIADPLMGRLTKAYRGSWHASTFQLRALAAVLRALHGAGIETMLLGAAALALRYYRDVGLRPIDVDILVPTHQGLAAIEILKGLGWTPHLESAGQAQAEALAVGPYTLRNAHREEVDLHWHVFHQRHEGGLHWNAIYHRVSPAVDGEIWATAQPISLAGVPTQILGPADQLLHVCIQEMERTQWGADHAPNLRWIADATMVLRNTPDSIDWDRLFARAERLAVELPIRDALNYLHTLLDTPVPATVEAQSSAMPAPRAVRITEHAGARSPRPCGL